MGYAFVVAPCLRCKVPFTFNPHRVPSMRVSPQSPRQPVCESCFNILNEGRKELGLEPWTRADDAYEAIEESEL